MNKPVVKVGRKHKSVEQENRSDLKVFSSRPPEIAPLVPTAAYDTYWRFAAERQEIFFRRCLGALPPWSDDPIFQEYKFTNAYRLLDRTTQFLLRNVIYRSDLPDDREEVVFRILLFKIFNKIETWNLLESALGRITYADFSFDKYDKLLTATMERQIAIYSAAYIMPSAGVFGHVKKHRNHLTLIERMMSDDLPKRLGNSKSMQAAFGLLRDYPTIGDFLAYQFVTDINYSNVTLFSEAEFVVAGPGALDGIKKCFADTAGLTSSEIIKFVMDRQESEFDRLGLGFRDLWGRRLQLIDCQNLFCEVDKYSRVFHPTIQGLSGRTRIKQRFTPTEMPLEIMLPPKWSSSSSCQATLGIVTKQMTLPFDTKGTAMDMDTYQKLASETDRNPNSDLEDFKSMAIPLLGLAGETGEIVSEYKKFLRDGDGHHLFRERFSEELGDLLWYLANVATKFGLKLEDIALQNITKCKERFASSDRGRPFDEGYPESQRLPPGFQVDFNTVHTKEGKPRMNAYYNGEPFGSPLTDNAYEGDGYRFHDVFHLAFAAVLGWSPITRSLLGAQRRSNIVVDEVEDGGRAKAIEEGISALVFAFGKEHKWLADNTSLSADLLRTIKSMTSHLEVSRRTTGDWENAITQGFHVWREIKKRGGGTLVADLVERTLSIKDHQ